MEKVRTILEKDLKENVVPFWNNMVDKEFGGFYGAVDMEHQIIKEAPKGIVYISRILYSYSGLYLKYKVENYLECAKVAYEFLTKKMYDEEFGGFYWSCTNEGKPLNDNKHLYGVSFALYGLANYYMASKDIEVLKYAEEMLEIISKTLEDFPNNYFEQFTRDFKVLENRVMEGYGMVPDITTNTLLHLAESLSLYYYANGNEKAKEKVEQILDVLFSKCYDYENDNLYVFVNRNFENEIDVYSYGHNLEVSWLFMETMRLCNIENPKYFETCKSMFETNFEKAYRNGYVINQMVEGIVDRSAIWWIQAESLAALKNIYGIQPKEEYLLAMENITDFIQNNLMNSGKEWYWAVNEDLSVQKEHSICEMWKANYHNVRAVLRILEGD